MRKIIPLSYQIKELKFFDGPPAKRFANLSEQELNRLVEHRHSEKTKRTTNWSVSTFPGTK